MKMTVLFSYENYKNVKIKTNRVLMFYSSDYKQSHTSILYFSSWVHWGAEKKSWKLM